ncbi:phage tail domain-containing protein, partial [Klebsiella pneumoniae]|uniref:phage tail domain-containing protein n=1 Tax=Klebsiella pneumoniae TaxID=573 RepID=UPI0029DCD231
ESRPGIIPLGTSYDGRKLLAAFTIQGTDHEDFQLKMDRAYQLFSTDSEMTIMDSRQPGKYWKVKVESEFEIEPLDFYIGQ